MGLYEDLFQVFVWFSNFETFQLIFIISDGKDVEADEIGEHFWGEILERTCSVDNMNFGNIESGRKESDCSESDGQ